MYGYLMQTESSKEISQSINIHTAKHTDFELFCK